MIYANGEKSNNVLNVRGRVNAFDIGGALLVLLFIWSFAVVFTLNFRPFYYIYISLTGLPDAVGISMDELMSNYDALIGYNTIFNTGQLGFPTFALSDHGRIHYEDVKHIFVLFEVACYASAAGLIAIIIRAIKKRRFKFLTIGSAATLISIPALLAVFAAGSWEDFFIKFHETFFSNNYWVFDAKADPSILMLPDGYFLACAVMIFALVAGLSVVGIAVARRRNKLSGFA